MRVSRRGLLLLPKAKLKNMKNKYISCGDRTCGADDCPSCYPGNFIGGEYIADIDHREQDARQVESDRQWSAVVEWVKIRSVNAGHKTPDQTLAMVCEIMRLLAQPEDAQCDRYILELREAMGI